MIAPAPESAALLGTVHATVLISAFGIFWFLAFFCLLSAGLGSELDPDTGAPLHPKLGLKALIATGVAAALFGVFYVLILMGVLEL